MSGTDLSSEPSSEAPASQGVAMRLEVVVIPVADVDRAKAFYEGLGWRLDADIAGEAFRIVQLTPPASEAAIIFGRGITSAAPGSIDCLLLVVDEIDAARDELVARGVDASEVFHGPGAGFLRDITTHLPGPDPDGNSYSSFVSFSDPDGNSWVLQEIKQRLPGREWNE